MASSTLTFGPGDDLRTVHDPFGTSSGYTINGVAITNGVGGADVEINGKLVTFGAAGWFGEWRSVLHKQFGRNLCTRIGTHA